MAGDTKLFQEALKRGSAHAWNEQWDKAAEEYRRALREFPEDISARTYLAMALYKAGSYQDSLQVYQSLWSAQPSNLTVLQRVAELQEAIGDRESAAMSYGRLAEAHTRRRAPKDAVKAWLKIVELNPGNPLLWNSLIQMAVQAGTIKEVIPGYLGLARELALQGRFQEAVQIAERAQSLDPDSPLVVPMLTGVRKGIEYSLRAAGFGEEVYPEDLLRYIPSIETLQSRAALAASAPPGTTQNTDAKADLAEQVVSEYEARQATRAVAEGQRLFQLLFRPGSELIEQSPIIEAVRRSLTRLGNVVDVRPEVEANGSVVFVILVTSALDPASIKKAIEYSWLSPGSVRQADLISTSQAPNVEVREAAPEPESPSVTEVEETPPLEEVVPVQAATEPTPPAEPEILTSAVAEQEGVSPDAEEPEGLVESEIAEEPVPEEAVAVSDAEAQEAPEAEAQEGESIEPADAAQSPFPGVTSEEFEALTSETPAAEAEPAPEEAAPPVEEPAIVEQTIFEDGGGDVVEAAAEKVESPIEPSEVVEAPEAAEVEPEIESVQSDSAEVEAEEELAGTDAQPVEISEGVEETGVLPEPSPEPFHGWEQLIQEAESARSAGHPEEAIALYEQAIAAGASGAQQFVDLGELYEQLDRHTEAAEAFRQAATTSPELPRAMLGLARLDLLAHRLDSSEAQARKALRAAMPDYPEAEAPATDLLLDILQERAAYGDLGGTADGLAWLKSVSVVDRLPEPVVERMAVTPGQLLGQSMAEHLEEITAIPRFARGEVVSSLWKSERLMEEGKLRSAADEMFAVISSHPDFLPAQSVLGRVLVAQGKPDEAGRRSHRLLDLYDLRRKDAGALEVLTWMVDTGLATGQDRRKLARLLRSHGRIAEAEAVEGEIDAEERAELVRQAAEDAERRAAEEAAMKAAEEARRAAEEAARRAAEEAERRAAEEAARRAAAEEAVKRALDELGRKAEEEEAHAREIAAAEAAAAEAAAAEAATATSDIPVPELPVDQATPVDRAQTDEPVEVELPREAAKSKRGGIFRVFGAFRGGAKKNAAQEKPAEEPGPAIEIASDVMARDALLRLAESKFAFGDVKGTAALIRSALQDERISGDVATRVALLRVLRVTSPSEDVLRETLADILETLDLPEELAD